MALEGPDQKDEGVLAFLAAAEIISIIIFTIEALLKIASFGFKKYTLLTSNLCLPYNHE